MIKDMVDTYLNLQTTFSSDRHRKWLMALVEDLGNIYRRKSYLEDLERLESEHGEIVPFDGNPQLLGFQNVVFDARDCSLREHRATDYLTTLLPYDLPSEPDETVQMQIRDMIADIITDPEVREFLMLMLCLHLEGINRHDIAMIWSGVGGNGKTLMKTLMKETFVHLHKEPPATFLTNERPGSDRPCSDLMDLKDAKSVFTSEPQAGKKTNSGFLKFITGRDPVRIRNVHSAVYTEYTPRFLVTLLCDVIPQFEGGEDDVRGIWRRLKIIKFESIFNDNPNPKNPREKQKDATLEDRIAEWGPQFMMMLIEHFKRYVNNGRRIHVPQAVEQNLADEKAENSPFETWLNENLLDVPGKRVHLHRFDRAYTLFQTRENTKDKVKTGTIVSKLRARGYHVGNALLDNQRDAACCGSALRYVEGADVKNWSELGLNT